MESVLSDIRLAVRGLRRNPGFTTGATVTLALGIGATTALFSVVYGVPPLLGRTFRAGDGLAGRDPVIVLSEGTSWC
jgi:hypothetical protein